jgi:DNA-binding transcriptional MerR regulator
VAQPAGLPLVSYLGTSYLTLSYNSVRIATMADAGKWTIDELCAQAEAALADGAARQPSGRVREIPDRRTIRWYSTIGLLDRPAAMHGRTALYNQRHLLQLLAVKRLQARGVPLAEVQTRLAGATDRMLARLAQTDDNSPAPAPAAGQTTARPWPAQAGRPRFWAVQTGSAAAAAGEAGAEAAAAELPPAADTARRAMLSASAAVPAATSRSRHRQPHAHGQPALHPDLLPAIRLGNGVTLALGAAARPLDADDIPALQQAARPLLELLSQRGLDEPRG